jgi:ATP-dependent helicase HrpB
VVAGPSDLLEILERFREAERAQFAPQRLNSLSLDVGATQGVDRVRRQLSKALVRSRSAPSGPEAHEQALGLCVLAGYPDRLARRRRPRAPELVLQGGGSATLSEGSVVQDADLMVAVDVEERSGRGGPQVVVRIASRVEIEWLLELFPEDLREEDSLFFDPGNRRVERVQRVSFGGLVLEESRSPAQPSEETSRVLAEAALAAGIDRFVPPDELEQVLGRIELLARNFPEAGFVPPDQTWLRQALEGLCEGAQNFDDLRGGDLLQSIENHFTPEQLRLWRSMTPDKVSLPGNRQVAVHYERGKPPWLETRLQDLFGMAQGPAVCGGRERVVLHLLAPNHRAVQVTTDLKGFWERHYPVLRKELCRKYPRHSWPEDPTSAQTPAQLGRRH